MHAIFYFLSFNFSLSLATHCRFRTLSLKWLKQKHKKIMNAGNKKNIPCVFEVHFNIKTILKLNLLKQVSIKRNYLLINLYFSFATNRKHERLFV